jgi:glycosyltransferase involved in cell wall biosynthesis
VSTGDFVIGAVGRLEPQKDFASLIDAFSRVVVQVPEARLLIAGDGSLRAVLQAQIERLGLQHQCRLLGHVDDVRQLHHALDLFAQASVYEGTPNSVLEAMALETAIVATDAGGTAELARHGSEALIIPCRDTEALTGAMLTAIREPAARGARVRAARQRVETELSFETRLRRIEAIYDALSTRYPRGRPPRASALTACETS